MMPVRQSSRAITAHFAAPATRSKLWRIDWEAEVRRSRDDFLNDCSPGERAAFETIFSDIETLARGLGDPAPHDERGMAAPLGESPLRLRLTFDHEVGWSLHLRHPKLSSTASLLWGFPSRNIGQAGWANSLRTAVADLRAAGIPAADIEAYGVDLERAEFDRSGGDNWQTTTAGDPEGVSRIFRYPVNRTALVTALRNVVQRIGAQA